MNEKPKKPRKGASENEWDAYHAAMRQYNRVHGGSRSGLPAGSDRRKYYPGSTRHTGEVHVSRGHPFEHADLRVTDLDGRTEKVHSVDQRDMDLGNMVRETMRQIRAKLRGD